ANRASFSSQRPALVGRSGGSSRRAGRRLRRVARRQDRLTLADYLAYWRAQRCGRQYSRGRANSVFSMYPRISLVVVFLLAGLTAGMLFI
ncbi:MAG: hypothetical protein J2P20_19835, partial [Pseudonocardia sp.]|nr:hypothetical protein [Pseudonocardia sp.]